MQEINGLTLYNWPDVAYAFFYLWLYNGETFYELTVLRGTTHLDFDYEVIATL